MTELSLINSAAATRQILTSDRSTAPGTGYANLDDCVLQIPTGAAVTEDVEVLSKDGVNYRRRLLPYHPVPTSVETLNNVSTLPTPTDNADGNGLGYRLGDILYDIGEHLSLAYPIIPTVTTGESLRFDGNNYRQINYSATGALFRANLISTPANMVVDHVRAIGDNSNTFLDYTTTGSLSMFDGTITNFADVGTFTGRLIQLARVTTGDCAQGLKVDATTVCVVSDCAFQDSTPTGKRQLSISGTFLSTAVEKCQFIPMAGDYAFYIDPSITGKVNISNVNVVTAYGGLAFDPAGLDQTHPQVTTSNCEGIPDSQTIGSLGWVNNTTETIISTINTWVKVAGVTTPIKNERCSQTDNNQLTFTNLQTVTVNASFFLDVLNADTGTPTIEFALYKNGSAVQLGGTDFTKSVEIEAVGPKPVLWNFPIDIVSGDVLEIWARNVSSTANFIVTDGTHTAN